MSVFGQSRRTTAATARRPPRQQTVALRDFGPFCVRLPVVLWSSTRSRSIQVALNQTQQGLAHLTRLVEDSYQRKRKQIINGHGYDPEDH